MLVNLRQALALLCIGTLTHILGSGFRILPNSHHLGVIVVLLRQLMVLACLRWLFRPRFERRAIHMHSLLSALQLGSCIDHGNRILYMQVNCFREQFLCRGQSLDASIGQMQDLRHIVGVRGAL